MSVLFWIAALGLGYAFTKGVQLANISLVTPGPTSPVFMLLSLFLVTVLYQTRTNVEQGWPKSARFVFGPPMPTILIDVAAFFAGSLYALNGLSGFR